MSHAKKTPKTDAAGYHSADDARRMQEMVRALLQGRRAIALSCASTTTLEHYSRLLVRDLRQHENVKVVAHHPGSTEQLVAQVNALVADVSVDHVIDRGTAAQRPVHVFVVHDRPQLSDAEFSLLVRLVSDLPGANLRIALIQDRDLEETGHLRALGPQALHWVIGSKAAKGAVAAAAPAAEGRTREALAEALRESPDTPPGDLPGWARAPQEAPRRRWRLAFWRRRHGQAPAAAPAKAGPVKTARAATPATPAKAAKAMKAARPAAKAAAARPAGKPAAARTEPPKARSNRVVLVAGVFLSAGLAGGLGMWLQMHQPAPRASASAPATPVRVAPTGGATPSPAAVTAAIAQR